MPTPPDTAALLDAIAQPLSQAQRVLFITGAGISADSGIPTYRGVSGLYNRNITEEGCTIEEALSGDMLATHPAITWKYLAQIEANCRGAQPNAAHRAIAQLQSRLDAVVFTQNIDGLHRQAGSQSLIEIHGNLETLYCPGCGYATPSPDWQALSLPPVCPDCGGLLRPDVVLFGEALPEAALEAFYDALEEGFDMVFTIGTSSVFPYITEPVLWAARQGIPTVEINPTPTRVTPHVHFPLALGAAEAMTGLLARL